MKYKREPSGLDYVTASQRTKCVGLSTKRLFSGSMLLSLAQKSVTQRLLLRCGSAGSYKFSRIIHLTSRLRDALRGGGGDPLPQIRHTVKGKMGDVEAESKGDEWKIESQAWGHLS